MSPAQVYTQIPAFKRAQIVISIADKLFNLREQMRVRTPCIKQRDFMATLHGIAHEMRSDESVATENKNFESAPACARPGNGACRPAHAENSDAERGDQEFAFCTHFDLLRNFIAAILSN